MSEMKKIEQFLKSEGIRINNINNYKLPFIHSSYTHEAISNDSYERLEFLGDSILGQIVSEHLYRNFPEYNQGDMTLIKHYVVNKEYLSMIGRKINIEKYMWLGSGENRDNLSDSVYEDVIESLVAAIYLDAGVKETKKWLNKHILSKIQEMDTLTVKDSKTRLQELLQSEKRETVQYNTSNGKRDNKNNMVFTSKAMFDKQIIGTGTGGSKKEAEKTAAKNAIERMV